MQIRWPLITILFCLSLPGVLIAIPRLITILLPDNSEELRGRLSRIAIAQTLVMIFFMSLAGTVLALRTGLDAPLLNALLQGQSALSFIQKMVLPTLLYTLGGLLIFLILYYRLVGSILDETSLQVMRKMRAILRPDGCILYGVVEEVFARWGLMNVVAFFAILYAEQKSASVIWIAIIISGILFGVGQIPAYIAAGCQASRRFIYTIVSLSLWQAILFGWLFWQYGLESAIIAHMLFHFGWSLYDKL